MGMRFGPPSLSRIWCAKCKEETLHKSFGECVHCGRRVVQAPTQLPFSMCGRVVAVPPRMRTKIAKELRDNALEPLASIAKRLGCSVALLCKISKEYGVARA
jgi:hypothetical protein